MEELKWAQISGLFDGEGHIYKNKACLTFGMCDLDLVELFKEVTGIDNAIKPHKLKSGKPHWVVYVTGKSNVVRVLKRMLPYLGKRRTEAALTSIQRIEAQKPHGNSK